MKKLMSHLSFPVENHEEQTLDKLSSKIVQNVFLFVCFLFIFRHYYFFFFVYHIPMGQVSLFFQIQTKQLLEVSKLCLC